ncbi:hypothetical protein ROA7450_03587 [Roseovarius albus]|uniref:Lipoprotein n=1 Tax=Roseovarius albus TaxID=1247867 RepID=A0A1X7A1C2_9RHOB|nr:hypothetical protein [Roseovarius albus]SLN67272.1 hypothetical protein ROA7450_03587 [Roseovarius albus]
MKKIFAAIAGVGLVVSCSQVVSTSTSSLGNNLVVDGGKYTSGGGLTIAAELRNNQGRTMLCGVWAQSRQQSILTKNVERKVLGVASFFAGNERIHTGFVFMNEVPPSASYVGQQANCITLQRAWRPEYANNGRMRIPRVLVYGDFDPFGDPSVYFIQEGPRAGDS